MSRGDRFDWVIQKSTELGVASITPLLSERTEVKLNEQRAEKKLQHWQHIAISACEQCGRNTLPVINALDQLAHWAGSVSAQHKLVLHHRATAVTAAPQQPKSLALLVGPEGGLSEAEINLAQTAGFTSMALGPRVLRTETAPVAALAILQSRWGDMQPN